MNPFDLTIIGHEPEPESDFGEQPLIPDGDEDIFHLPEYKEAKKKADATFDQIMDEYWDYDESIRTPFLDLMSDLHDKFYEIAKGHPHQVEFNNIRKRLLEEVEAK